ncbi:MAG TPA: helix-turn-helix domain-containing protein [Candidatus Saccharimonadales bacterium]|nr:helix-turn-helix domain-containing protein [Candidatus Saccharimonadales bacterium]
MITAEKAIGCVKAATDILGDKWTPQLLRFFANEDSLRFCHLQDLVGGINPRTLSARLAHLESEGVIEKTPTSATSRCEYRLTDKGRELLPIIRDMERWSAHYEPSHN